MITYISIDIETDGPLIGINSMLSLGAAAFKFSYNDGMKPYSTFEVNLEALPGAVQDQNTMEDFWSKNQEAWNIATKDPITPQEAITKFITWYNTLPGQKIIAAYPANFDFAWLRHYVILFAGRDYLSYEALDIKSLSVGILKKSFHEVKTARMPDHWRDRSKRMGHKAVDDAIIQGIMLMNILNDIGITQ